MDDTSGAESPAVDDDAACSGAAAPDVRRRRRLRHGSTQWISGLIQWSISLVAVYVICGGSGSGVVHATNPRFNIATFIYTNCPNGPVLDANFSLSPVGSDINQAYFLYGYKLWRDTINNNTNGGLSITPLGSTNSTTVPVNVTFFCPGPMAADTVLVPKAVALLRSIVNQTYGAYPVFITNPTSTVQMSAALMAVCEETKACVFIHPLSATTSLFECGGGGTINPIECLQKSRRVGARRFDYSFSLFPAEGQILTPFLNLMFNKQLKKLVIIPSSADSFAPASTTVQKLTANANGLTVQLTQFVSNTWTDAQWTDFLYNVSSNYAPDAIAMTGGTASVAACIGFMKAMRSLNYLPQMIYLGSCGPSAYLTDAQVASDNLQRYFLTTTPWDPRLRGTQFRAAEVYGSTEPFPATIDDDSPQVFTRMLKARFGDMPVSFQLLPALAAAACMMAQKALENNPIIYPFISAETILAGMRILSAPSHYGTLSFDQWGRLVPLTFTFAQWSTGGAFNLLTPLVGGVDPIVPAPTWDEREYNPQLYTELSEHVILGLNSAVIAYSLGLLIAVIVHREKPMLKAATPVFCVITCIGGILLLCSVYVWTMTETNLTCGVKIWMLQFGFTLFFSSMLIKTIRVWYIAEFSRLAVRRVTDMDLLLYLGAVCAFEIVFTGVWVGVAPFTTRVLVVDPIRPLYNHTVCSGSSVSTGFLTAALVFKFTLMGMAMFMAFRVRKVPSEYNESTYMGVAVWTVSLLMLIGVPVIATSQDIVFSFYVRSLGLMVLVASTLTILFVPKLLSIEPRRRGDSPPGAAAGRAGGVRVGAGAAGAGGHAAPDSAPNQTNTRTKLENNSIPSGMPMPRSYEVPVIAQIVIQPPSGVGHAHQPPHSRAGGGGGHSPHGQHEILRANVHRMSNALNEICKRTPQLDTELGITLLLESVRSQVSPIIGHSSHGSESSPRAGGGSSPRGGRESPRGGRQHSPRHYQAAAAAQAAASTTAKVSPRHHAHHPTAQPSHPSMVPTVTVAAAPSNSNATTNMSGSAFKYAVAGTGPTMTAHEQSPGAGSSSGSGSGRHPVRPFAPAPSMNPPAAPIRRSSGSQNRAAAAAAGMTGSGSNANAGTSSLPGGVVVVPIGGGRDSRTRLPAVVIPQNNGSSTNNAGGGGSGSPPAVSIIGAGSLTGSIVQMQPLPPLVGGVPGHRHTSTASSSTMTPASIVLSGSAVASPLQLTSQLQHQQRQQSVSSEPPGMPVVIRQSSRGHGIASSGGGGGAATTSSPSTVVTTPPIAGSSATVHSTASGSAYSSVSNSSTSAVSTPPTSSAGMDGAPVPAPPKADVMLPAPALLPGVIPESPAGGDATAPPLASASPAPDVSNAAPSVAAT